MKETTISLDEWTQAIEETCRLRIDTVPPGWLTAIEFAAQCKCGESMAGRYLRALRASGRLDYKKFVIRSGERTFAVMHYRLKKK